MPAALIPTGAHRAWPLTPMKKRRGLWAVAVVLLAAIVTVFSAATRITPHIRDLVVTALNERFESEVELKSLQVSIFPRIAVQAEGLILRHKGRRDVPPLIQIDSFAAGAGLFGLIGKPLHLRDVRLQGLRIHVPPGGLHDRPPDTTTPGRQNEKRESRREQEENARRAPASTVPPPEPSEPLPSDLHRS